MIFGLTKSNDEHSQGCGKEHWEGEGILWVGNQIHFIAYVFKKR